MNSVQLLGRITKDIELKKTLTDTSFISFSVAINRPTKEPKADFITCKAYGKTADFISKYFSKGQQIALNGHIQTNYYEKDGRNIYTTDVIVQSVFFAGNKKETQIEILNELENEDLPWK